jgi:hypothetical protein
MDKHWDYAIQIWDLESWWHLNIIVIKMELNLSFVPNA